MALLIRARDGARFILGDPSLVGRDGLCDLRLADGRVSQHHARIVYAGGQWALEELGSRNGTLLNGSAVTVGTPRPLNVDDVVVFGNDDEAWHVADLRPPGLFVRSEHGETLAGEEALSIPRASEPLGTIYRQPTGRWVFESAEGVRPLEHRTLVVVDAVAWRVFLPDTRHTTRESVSRAVGVRDVALHFSVSSDEEDVEINLHVAGRIEPLRQRSHFYLLLTLARERLRDAEASTVAPAEHGWVYRDDLCKMLRLSRSQMFLQVHRARKQLEGMGIANAFDLVERRAGSGQLRLGVAQLVVRRRGGD